MAFQWYQDHLTLRHDVYLSAADVDYHPIGSPNWDRQKAEEFLRGSKCGLSSVHHEEPYSAGYVVANDEIWRHKMKFRGNYDQPEMSKERPVLFIAPDEGKEWPPVIFRSLLDSLFKEMDVLADPDRARGGYPPRLAPDAPMASYIENLRDLGNSPVKSSPSWMQKRLVVVVDLDRADSEETNILIKKDNNNGADAATFSAAEELVRALERAFVAQGKGDVLFVTQKPYDIASLVEDKARVVDISKSE
ncbi:hypothetical protein F4779DRAFT_642117 [Xylariaceae sp. FL0662B]|nr:hypothetical protein F4779DRAFT_642117 [Xylariaceae sp. FL0662B]